MATTQGDNFLLEAIRMGDSTILRKMYEQNFHVVADMIEKNNGSKEDARDIFQEGIMVIYEKLKDPNFTLTSNFSTYLYSVCKYLWMNQLRKKSRTEVTLDDTITSIVVNDIERDIAEKEKRQLYQEKFSQLGEDCQQLLSLFFSGSSMKEIVEKMKLSSIAYAKKRKFVCKEKLISLIEKDRVYTELMRS
ncbi:MAG: sigma-70 family RNA polymerase sigma factor [Bacteroidia bacterium]